MCEKTKDKTKVAKMNCPGGNLNNEGGCAVQQWAQAADRYSAAEKLKLRV